MKKTLALFLALLLLSSTIYLSNKTYFNALLLDDFYNSVYSNKFDVLMAGTTITIPLEFKYHTEHGFTLVVPVNDNYAHPRIKLNGKFEYKFTKNSKVIKQGTFTPYNKSELGTRNNYHMFDLFYFDLPFENQKNVTLKVTVIEPVTNLKKYAGEIGCIVAPTYSVKRGGERKHRLGIYF